MQEGGKSQKEEKDMKRKMLLSLLVLFIPVMVFGQDKVDAPVWKKGDKWAITGDVVIEVVSADESSYGVKYITSGGDSVLVVEKSSLNRLYAMDKDRRIPYEGRNKRLFNFPLTIGKSWQDRYKVKATSLGAQEYAYVETFTVLGWEEITVQAGKMKAIKIEYKQARADEKGDPTGKEGKVWYWYSPDVKYMVKCQYERTSYWDEFFDWELTAFILKK